MAGERPTPHGQQFDSVVIVVNNPAFEDPVAQSLLDKARRVGFPVNGVIVGKRTEISHSAGSLPEAVTIAATMAGSLLANPTAEVVKSVTTAVSSPLTPKNLR